MLPGAGRDAERNATPIGVGLHSCPQNRDVGQVTVFPLNREQRTIARV